MPSVELEPTISTGERSQTYALDRAANVVKWSEGLSNRVPIIIRIYTDHVQFYCFFHILLDLHIFCIHCTGLFASPSGISELDCATTKRDRAERSISIGREYLQVFFLY